MGKFGAAPNSDAERKAVECYGMLQAAEADLRSVGVAFGRAVIALRKETGHGKWIPRLKELGISYDKARYWVAKAGGKPTNRHKDASDAPFGWADAIDWLDDLRSKVATRLKDSRPQDRIAFAARLVGFARALRRDDRKRRGHAKVLLQRERQAGGSVASAAHQGRPHSAGGRR
jgi:hypothetical protein